MAFILLCAPSVLTANQSNHTYDAQNRLIRSDYGNGQVVEYVYDAAGNQIGQKAASSPSEKPDLIVTSITSPTTGVVGGKLAMTMTIKNQGTKDSGGFFVNFYLSPDSSITLEDIFTGIFCEYKAGLKAGVINSCSGDIAVPATLSPGKYYLGAYIDPKSAVEESNEANNGLAAANVTNITKDINYLSYVLKVVKPTTGIVTSAPEGINCGGVNKACFASFAESFTLTATPNSGYGFKKWIGCPNGTGPTCSMTLTKDSTVKVSFVKLPKYTLKISKSPNGSITSSPAGLVCKEKTKTCSGKFVSGTQVTLTAIPAAGKTFTGWGGVCSGRETCLVPMDGAKRVTATFE